ncbi:MAG: GNAT family N-acetyltransferase [Eubacteriales bacterium]|nr:GNAT family N-acetyltransferase [Eubacteriales bacterium]
MIKYRTLQDEDLDVLARMSGEMWAPKDIRYSEDLKFLYGELLMYSFMMKMSYTCVAEDDGRVVGMAVSRDVSDGLIWTKYVSGFAEALIKVNRTPGGDRLMEYWDEYVPFCDEMDDQTDLTPYGGELQLFLVDPEYRGKHVGSGMFQHVLEFWHRRGIKQYYLHTENCSWYHYYEGRNMKRIAFLPTTTCLGEVENLEMYCFADDVETQRAKYKDKIEL